MHTIYMGLCVQYIHIHTLYMDIHYFCVYLTNTHYPASGTATTTHLKGQFQILTWFWDYQSNCMFFNKLKVLRRNHVEKFISPFHAFFKCLQSWSLHHSNKKKKFNSLFEISEIIQQQSTVKKMPFHIRSQSNMFRTI